MVQIHWPVAFRRVDESERFPVNEKTYLLDIIDIPLTETWQALEALVKKGKIRSIGVSNFSIPNLELLWEAAEIKPVVNQVELHPYFQQKQLFDWCTKRVRAAPNSCFEECHLTDILSRTSCLRLTAPWVTTFMDCPSKTRCTVHVRILRRLTCFSTGPWTIQQSWLWLRSWESQRRRLFLVGSSNAVLSS